MQKHQILSCKFVFERWRILSNIANPWNIYNVQQKYRGAKCSLVAVLPSPFSLLRERMGQKSPKLTGGRAAFIQGTGQMQIKTGCQHRLALDGCGCSQPSCLPCSPDEPSVPPSAGWDYFMKQLLNQQRFPPLISNEGVLKFLFKSEGVTLEGMGDFLKTSFRSRRQVRKQNGCERLLRRNKQPSIIQVSVFAVWGNRGSVCCQVRDNSNPLRCFGGAGTGGRFL